MDISLELTEEVRRIFEENNIQVSFEDYKSFDENLHQTIRIHRLGVAFLRIIEATFPVEKEGIDDDCFETSNEGNYVRLIVNNRYDYYLEYDDEGFVLYCSKHYPQSALERIKRNLLFLNKKLISKHEEVLREKLVHKNLSIRNSFISDYRGVTELAQLIETKYKEYADSISDGSIAGLIWYNSQTGVNDERFDYEFEISCYIQKVFSLIEHFSMCLLPLWEYSDSREWHIIKEEAGYYFVPDTWTTFLLNKDKLKDFMLLFEKVMEESNRDLKEEYRNAKDDLRNVITHGYLTSMRLDNLKENVPSLHDGYCTWIEPNFNQIDYFSFKRVENLLKQYLGWAEKANPAFYYLISHGLDIPANALEIVNYVGNDPKKAEEFIHKWERIRDEALFPDFDY